MRITSLIFALLLVITGCTMPSYKKNEIVKSENDSTTSNISFFDIPRNQQLTADQQIASAVMAAPADAREGAKVYGYDESGEFMTLREGTNNFICIADNPKRDGFQVVCYHSSLEPMMARGRELEAEGKSRDEKENIREEEARSGKLALPESPATLHIYYGEDAYFDAESNAVMNAKYRYVVYIPFATHEDTGLPLSPNESSHPWLMFPGKYNAHIMITPAE